MDFFFPHKRVSETRCTPGFQNPLGESVWPFKDPGFEGIPAVWYRLGIHLTRELASAWKW
jgi:hypothetical protein